MPELPEVETTRRGIRSALRGRRITGMVLREPRLRWPGASGALSASAGGWGVTFAVRHARELYPKGLQADLNAAANIGLRALMDPDWPARWWYVPCNSKDFKPDKDKVKGCSVVDADTLLKTAAAEGDPGTAAPRGKRKAKAPAREIVNLWRDVSARTVSANDGPWEEYPAYWNKVQARVIGNLRKNWPSFADK
jgi:hypothetical protein